MAKSYQRRNRRDLGEHFVCFAENANLETAERSLVQAQASFQVLAEQPMIGAPLTLHNPVLAGMRKWRVKDFDNHLIFYLPHQDGVSVVRVLHAVRDWWTLLGIEA